MRGSLRRAPVRPAQRVMGDGGTFAIISVSPHPPLLYILRVYQVGSLLGGVPSIASSQMVEVPIAFLTRNIPFSLPLGLLGGVVPPLEAPVAVSATTDRPHFSRLLLGAGTTRTVYKYVDFLVSEIDRLPCGGP